MAWQPGPGSAAHETPNAPGDAPADDEGARAGQAVLGEREAEAYLRAACFTAGPPGRTGVELEWLVRDPADPGRLPPPGVLDAALAPLAEPGALPGGGRITREPGGQIELATSACPTLADCAKAAAADVARLRAALADAGLAAVGLGLEPRLTPPRTLDHPRYRAMEGYFDRFGPAGRVMMRATASVQISLEAGDESDGVSGYRHRWLLAHRLGPVLVAAFANSPLWRGRPTGWKSTRQALWARIDPGRTRPPDPAEAAPDAPEAAAVPDTPEGTNPRADWARYALDAQLLCVRRTPPAPWAAPPGRTFRSWLRGPFGERPPRLADLDYHLTTLFPPVRPRGWLELRMIDAQQSDDWSVPLAVATTLLDDPDAARAAWRATEPLTGGRPLPRPDLWLRAARLGPADPPLATAAHACLAAAESALARDPACAELRRAVADFTERYPARGRCPADDQLDPFDQREGVRR
ncbi:ergothioneine biosynthesis glutamate--cysteine ligase EgtA [Streptomyces sp. PT12]|uniref:ergothioneine biosynthesis glutamate--cysteine ligase EgtA n=1 Tax=Streptomyces sp. PT12 TaxID=1510197 RepID=UPI000DE1DDF3|nr:ergothioneine biosynthesis glutamate--cysteine ligase EgtA [Streptomyces sp. PT12]RBM16833.1 ergothioneine biosynthesis glutamate--cysteine ligase EgtA [Streptomyces sp. PT12]